MRKNYQLTFQQFLQNPSGPYSAFFGRRTDIKANLDHRFSELIKKYNAFKCEIYKDEDDYLFYIKIPSEKYDNLFYDTVLRLKPNNEGAITDLTLMNYEINFYSNSPAFVFTYAYVFNKDDLFIDFLKTRISNEALHNPPEVRNPFEIYGFEKSLYFALSYIKRNSYHVKSSIGFKCKKLNKDALKTKIKHSQDKMVEYNIAKQKELQKKREQNKTKQRSDKKGIELNKKLDRRERSIKNGSAIKNTQIDKTVEEIIGSEKKVSKDNKMKNSVIKPKKSTSDNPRNKLIKPKKSTVKNKKKK